MNENRPTQHLVLYDGECGLCHRLNRFLLRRDREERFAFASLRSAAGSQILSAHGIMVPKGEPDTFYLVTHFRHPEARVLARTAGIRAALSELGFVWRRLAAAMGLVPMSWKTAGYDWIARHRYRFFGRLPSCPLPAPEWRTRFMG